MSNAPDQTSQLQVWVTVVDPQTDDGRVAITEWDRQEPSQWAVPAKASEDDLVLAWVKGGTGFRYLLKVADSPRKALGDEFGPQQALLAVVEPIQPSVSMTQLKEDRALKLWWLVRYNMQGVVRAQKTSLARDGEWEAFLRLLESIAPKAAARLRVAQPERSTAIAGTSTAEKRAPAAETVSFLDEGFTSPETMTITHELGSVLARASAINQEMDSCDVSFSSLLLAVLYGDDALGRWLARYFSEQGVKVDHVLRKVWKDAGEAEAAARRGMERRDAILASPLRRTVSARQALQEAREIAAAQPVAHVDTDHVVAAIIALTDYHEEDFSALTLDRPRWGAAFVQHRAVEALDATEVAFWRRFYTRRFPGHELPPLETAERPGRRPDYDADAYTSRDLLAIEDEVAALAYVVAARQTQPPLAIGLFGEWGSGKTFFMKHLRRRIDDLSKGALAQQPSERDCHAHIALIEFNAWHYQDGNLWASLVDHILRNLRFGEDEEEARVSERRDQIVRELDVREARQTAAAARAADADERVGKAERRVEELKEKEQARREELAGQLTPGLMLTAARAGIRVDPALRQEGEQLAEELGIPLVQGNAVGLQDAMSEARRELAGVSAFLVPLFRAKDSWKRILLLGIAIAAPIAIWYVIHALPTQHELVRQITASIVGVGALISSAAKWISLQTSWIRALRERVGTVARAVNSAIDEGIEAGLSEQKKAVADKFAELDVLRQQQAAAQKERDDAASEAAALRTSLTVLGDEGLMRSFLDDRIGGGVYQEKLGIAALVRRDFERLSRKIDQVTAREGKGELKEGELVINRIVLYIDDLDRCEMDKVVPVLRAVHLLLAFQAFVAVVGVDSRWVARCLEEHHSDFFMNEENETHHGVTPLDYLEKIFQIPIWLEPVPPDRRISMVRELLRKPVAAPAATLPGEPPLKAEPPDPDPPRDPVPTGGSEPAEPVQSVPAPPETRPVPEKKDGKPLDLNPRGLSITDSEFDFLGQIGGLLSSSPRTIKRFVNTYRLISVGLAQAGFRDTELQPRDSEVRMLLLAVLVGMPDLSRWLQEVLRDRNSAIAITPLLTVMANSRTVTDATAPAYSRKKAEAEWNVVRDWMGERGEPWTTILAARFAEWLDPVGRYTFNLTRSRLAHPAPPTGSSASRMRQRAWDFGA